MDYGKKDPSLGWRFTDAWLSMAGNGDRGLPNGKPVDEWGIRAENGIPVGSSISRGGDANGPAAVYATTKFVEWLKQYAPPEDRRLSLRKRRADNFGSQAGSGASPTLSYPSRICDP